MNIKLAKLRIRNQLELKRYRNEIKEHYRTLFDRAVDGIVIMSLEGKLLEVNNAFARMHGYRAEEMLNMSLKDLDTPATFQMTPDRSSRFFAGEVLTFEVEHYHKDGHVIPFEVSASLIAFGGESYIQSFHRDITARKRVGDELALKTKNLEEANAALRGLINQVAEGKAELEGKILSNIREIVLPYVSRLKHTPLSDIQNNLLQTVESNLENITSTFLNSLKMKFYNLTPRESEVATFVREGKSAKEIAEILCLSEKTVKLYRGGLRGKLGLRNKKINLRSYLATIK